jgi:hypothetical protein
MEERLKTVRFTKVVAEAGHPQVVTLWVPPEKDHSFQHALKQHRVMTVHQENVGTRADFGEIGYTAGDRSALLIFPKSLKAFEGARVIGVKYDKIENPSVPPGERLKPLRSVTKAKRGNASPPKPESTQKPIKANVKQPDAFHFECQLVGTSSVSVTVKVKAATVAKAEQEALAEAERKSVDLKKVQWKWAVEKVQRES